MSGDSKLRDHGTTVRPGRASAEGKITYFVDTVFKYPTLAEGYKAAAFHGLNRLTGVAPGLRRQVID